MKMINITSDEFGSVCLNAEYILFIKGEKNHSVLLLNSKDGLTQIKVKETAEEILKMINQ